MHKEIDVLMPGNNRVVVSTFDMAAQFGTPCVHQGWFTEVLSQQTKKSCIFVGVNKPANRGRRAAILGGTALLVLFMGEFPIELLH